MSDKREVFFLIGRGGAVMWSDNGDSAATIPDSRARWTAIWERRDDVEEIAHSHPMGPARFSREDETTMEALDSGLGRRLRYSIVSPRGMVARVGHDGRDELISDEPWWAGLLRRASRMDDPGAFRSHDESLEALRGALTRQLRSRGQIVVHRGADLTLVSRHEGSPPWLVVEVADGGLAIEQEKAQAHARAGAEELWIVDPRSRSVEVFREPEDGTYRNVELHRSGAILALAHFDEISICVDDIV